MNQIIHGDSLEYMKTLPDKSIDLVLTDPPYGIGIADNPVRQKHKKKDWDSNIPMSEYFSEIFRISKNQIIWGGNYFIEYLYNSKGFLVWDKKQPFDFTLAMCEMAWTSIDKPAKMFRYSVQSEGANIHPTQKPKELFKWCLENYSQPGDLVLDCFAGSGTTAVACIETGRNYIVIEKEADYVEIIKKRVKNTTPPLFVI